MASICWLFLSRRARRKLSSPARFSSYVVCVLSNCIGGAFCTFAVFSLLIVFCASNGQNLRWRIGGSIGPHDVLALAQRLSTSNRLQPSVSVQTFAEYGVWYFNQNTLPFGSQSFRKATCTIASLTQEE
jgi:hypothetical protein